MCMVQDVLETGVHALAAAASTASSDPTLEFASARDIAASVLRTSELCDHTSARDIATAVSRTSEPCDQVIVPGYSAIMVSDATPKSEVVLVSLPDIAVPDGNDSGVDQRWIGYMPTLYYDVPSDCPAVIDTAGILAVSMRTLDPCGSGHGINLSSAGAVSVPCESTSTLSCDATSVVSHTAEPCDLSVVVLESVVISEVGCPCDDHVSLLRTPEPLSLTRTTRVECEVTSATGRGIHLLPTDVQSTTVFATEPSMSACDAPVVLLADSESELRLAWCEEIDIDARSQVRASLRTLSESPSPPRTAREGGDANSGRGIHLLPISKHLGNYSLGGAAGARTPLPLQNKCHLCSRACGSSSERPTLLPQRSSDASAISMVSAITMFKRRDATVTYKYRRRLAAAA